MGCGLGGRMEVLNPGLVEDIENGRKLYLELGGGLHKREGYYNIDACRVPGVDVVADLNQPLLLIPDNSVVSVISNHVLEHIPALEPLLRELHRITCPSGVIETVVPHFANPYFYSDPTHVRAFGLYTMCYFIEFARQPFRRKVPSFYTTARFELLDVRLEFFRHSRLDRIVGGALERTFNRSRGAQEFYERRLSWVVSARQIRWRMTPVKS